jgi:hypothetical protein
MPVVEISAEGQGVYAYAHAITGIRTTGNFIFSISTPCTKGIDLHRGIAQD